MSVNNPMPVSSDENIPGYAPCFTEKIPQERWLEEIKLLRERLQRFGITDVKAGMELDFILHPNGPGDDSGKWVSKKIDFTDEIESRIAHTSDNDEKRALYKKAVALRAFGPVEVLMYDLIEKNPASKDILEYSFGKENSREHTGYYDDHPPLIEMRIGYVSVLDLCRNHNIVISELTRKMEEYGLEFSPGYVPLPHISFSFWKDENNVLGLRSGDHTTTGAHITEGINKTCFDGFILWEGPQNAHNESLAAVPECGTYLRLSDGRIEGRLKRNGRQSGYHAEAIITTVLAGAVHGLEAHSTGRGLGNLIPAQANTRMIFSRPDATYKRVVDFLNTRRIPEGKNSVQEDDYYLTFHLAQFCEELGMIKNGEKAYDDLYARLKIFANYGMLSDALRDSFEASQQRLEALVEKVHAGESDIKYVGDFKSFEIGREHYRFGKDDSDPRAERDVQRLAASSALRKTLSADLLQELIAEAKIAFGEPRHSDVIFVREINNAITKTASSLRGMVQLHK